MKAPLCGLRPALAAAVLLTAVLAGCDGSHSTATSANSASAAASGSGTAATPSSGAASGTTATSGRAASGSTSRPGGRAASSTRAQAEVPATPATDPCKITSTKDVTRAFGGTVITAAAGTSGTGSNTCHYVLTRTRSTAGLVLDLSLTRNVSRSVFESVKKQPGNQHVSGVGQDAYYRSSTKALQIYVRGAVAAMQATPTKSVTAAQRSALRAHQISLGKSIAAQS